MLWLLGLCPWLILASCRRHWSHVLPHSCYTRSICLMCNPYTLDRCVGDGGRLLSKVSRFALLFSIPLSRLVFSLFWLQCAPPTTCHDSWLAPLVLCLGLWPCPPTLVRSVWPLVANTCMLSYLLATNIAPLSIACTPNDIISKATAFPLRFVANSNTFEVLDLDKDVMGCWIGVIIAWSTVCTIVIVFALFLMGFGTLLVPCTSSFSF